MASPIKKFFYFIFGKTKVRDRTLTELNPDISDNKIIKEQSKYIRTLEGQNSEFLARKRKKDVEEKENLDDIDLIKELKKKQDDIERKKYGDYYRLSKIYQKIKKNKKIKIELTDKDDEVVFDRFDDFVILLNEGTLGILGESGEVWADGGCLREIIHKPETIKNQIRRNRILLPFDKKFNFIPDLENLEMSEMTYDKNDGNWHLSEERMKTFKQMIIERDKRIQELREDKEHHEQVITDQRNKLSDLELAKNQYKSVAEASKTELSIALQTNKDAINQMGEMSRNLIVSQEQKAIADELKGKGDEIFKELSEKIKDKNSKTFVEQAKDEYENMFLFVKENSPQTIINQVPEELESGRIMVKPEQKLEK